MEDLVVLAVQEGSGFLRSFDRSVNSSAKQFQDNPKNNPQLSLPPPGDSVELTSSTDRLTDQYIYFIAGLRAESEGSDFFAAAAELQQELSSSSDFSREQGEVSAQVNSQIEAAFGAFSSGDGFSAIVGAIHGEFSAEFHAEVVQPDGTRVTVDASVEVEFDFSFAALSQRAAQLQQKSDPLALDIDGDGDISLTDEARGVSFDLNADGQLDRSAFVTGRDVFLALDRNSDGLINDGRELFGDQHGAANGFLELAQFDDDLNGAIDAQDSVFEFLRGVRNEEGAFRTYSLAQLGVNSLSLNYLNTDRVAQGGNQITQISDYQTTSGHTQLLADVMLNYRTLNTAA